MVALSPLISAGVNLGLLKVGGGSHWGCKCNILLYWD